MTVHPESPATTAAVSSLTLEQKASLTSGNDMSRTKEVPGIPVMVLSDGPHGVRKQMDTQDHLGLNGSIPATCFPPAVALGSTWDRSLVERVGAALGEECRAQRVNVLLGPGINIKRSPLGGRNFEYLSEDPILSGELGAAYIRGLQSRGVGASVKHFAANNQETDRLRSSSDISERPLREIYLRNFQRAVEDGRPWTVMCSYNRLNGEYASESRWLLSDVLRAEWGFDGVVVSDWGAVNDRVTGLEAGLDLEMPSSDGRTDAQIVRAVQVGELDEGVVDRAAGRIAELVRKSAIADSEPVTFDVDGHHALAREVAGRSIVLLRNDGGLLPLARQRVAVIGEFARVPRFQGGGSSHVVPTAIDIPLDEIRTHAGDAVVTFDAGFSIDVDETDSALVAAAVASATAADVAVVFLGLAESAESEGFDREHLRLPGNQLELLDAVLAANPHVVVVLSHGGVVDMSQFAGRVPAIVESWLLGQAGGGAIADVLYGHVNPSGRLAESIPLRLEDTPAYLSFPGENSHVLYGEGIFVGYRYYDARRMDVQFPFGHGLSYSEFEYSALSLAFDADSIEVRFLLTNRGSRAGREVAQVYISLNDSAVARAPRELKAFESVHLDAGESREVVVGVRVQDVAYWETRVQGWVVEGGEYTVAVGASSRDIRLRADIELEGDVVRVPLTLNSSLGELLDDPVAGPFIRRTLVHMTGGSEPDGSDADPALIAVMSACPIGRFVSFAGPGFDLDAVARNLELANRSRSSRESPEPNLLAHDVNYY